MMMVVGGGSPHFSTPAPRDESSRRRVFTRATITIHHRRDRSPPLLLTLYYYYPPNTSSTTARNSSKTTAFYPTPSHVDALCLIETLDAGRLEQPLAREFSPLQYDDNDDDDDDNDIDVRSTRDLTHSLSLSLSLVQGLRLSRRRLFVQARGNYLGVASDSSLTRSTRGRGFSDYRPRQRADRDGNDDEEKRSPSGATTCARTAQRL